MGELEAPIRGNKEVRDNIFDSAWSDVWGYRLGGAPAAWDQLIRDRALWYVTVLRALRVERSYLEVFGRGPTTDELKYWVDLPHNDSRVQSLQAMIDNHLQYLAGDSGARAELIGRSYVAVLGRQPDSGELEFWLGQPAQTIWALFERHEQYLAEAWPGVINDSYAAVCGRDPTDGEQDSWLSQPPRTLESMLRNHLQYFADDRDAWAGVIWDSYLAVFASGPTTGELDYWLGQTPRTIHTLIAAHREWLASNPEQAPAADDSGGLALASRGAPPVAPSSPGLLASVSGGGLVAAGGLNLIGQDGSGLVAAGAGNLVGNNGNTLVPRP